MVHYMGLIKAIGGAIRGTMADQWKEYFYCEALPVDVLAVPNVSRACLVRKTVEAITLSPTAL